MANSKKKCRFCSDYHYENDMTKVNTGWFCGLDCIVDYGMKNRTKGKTIKHKAEKKAFKDNDKPLRVAEAQKAFNAYIRKRDENEPCISCGRYHEGQYHAGHYKTTGARSDIRFNEDNCHKQCAPCNNHLSGNIGEYTPRLIEKIGQERFLALGLNRVKGYSCEELSEIEKKYKLKLKELNTIHS